MRKKLIELNKKIFEIDKTKINFKESFFSKPVIVSLICFILEIVFVIIAKKNSDNQSMVEYCGYAMTIFMIFHFFYIFFGTVRAFKETKQDLSVSLVESFKRNEKIKKEIFKLLTKIEKKDKISLINYHRYIKKLTKEDKDLFSFFFDGMQNLGLFSSFIFVFSNLKKLPIIIENNNLFEMLAYFMPLIVTIYVIVKKNNFLKYNKINYYIEEYFESKK